MDLALILQLLTASFIFLGSIIALITLIKPRRQNAEKRNFLVYKPLISEIKRIKERIEDVQVPDGNFDELRKELLITKKSRRLIDDLQIEILEYNALDRIVTFFAKLKIEETVKKRLEKTENIIKEQNISIHSTNSLIDYFNSQIDSILKNILLKNEIDLNWFSKYHTDVFNKISSYVIEGESLESFFSEINRVLSAYNTQGEIIWFFDRKRRNIFRLIEELENCLSKESQKLDSLYNFKYGGGKKIILEKLEKEEETKKLNVMHF